ncbi:MAG: carboxylesterase/lipase family protein [Chloroflexota bacterium]
MMSSTRGTSTAATSFGALRGVAEDGLAIFRGVPYARSPLGQLRFAPPQPPDGWIGVREATAFGPKAIQAASALSEGLNVQTPSSEDCLTLNVWTPALDDARRPVMVYLHGGAFVTGSGSMPMYHGAALARRGDVVVVNLNYRLGLFGYLRGIDVCGDALPSTGNEGLLDQIAALRWVKQEIAAFGGDPDNVTVFGQSAGARSIAMMLAMPSPRELFQKAILQSGPALALPSARANRVMEAILADLALEPHEAGRLRELPADQLLDVQLRVTPRAAGVAYGPTCDGVTVPSDPESVVAAGNAAGIPLMVGTTRDEYKFFRRLDPDVDTLTDDALLARLASPQIGVQAGDDARVDPAEAVALYRQTRAARGESTAASELWFAIMTDRRFRVPGMRLAELHAAHTPDTYTYLFTWQSPGWGGKLGAGHVVDVPFVLGTLDARDAQDLVPAGSDVGQLPAQMQDAWIAFARTGSPRTPALTGWAPYSAACRATMILGPTCHPEDAPFDAERQLWDARVGASGAPA